MKTYLVTGGAGFIGSHLVEALVSKGKVKVIDNLSTGSLDNLKAVRDEIEWIPSSVENGEDLEKAFKEVDVVFHEAAIASVPRSFEDPLGTHATNLTGTLNVLWAAKRCGVKRVVYASSAAVYGDSSSAMQAETDPVCPLSLYALHKHACEQYAQLFTKSFGLETVGLRYFNVFGPRQDPHSSYSGVISKFAERMTAGKEPIILGEGQQTRDFVYVKDVVRANLLAADVEDISGEVFNVGTGKSVSILALVDTLTRVLKGKKEAQFASARVGDILHSCARIEKAQQRLSYQPCYSLEEGLRELTLQMSQR